MSYGPIETDLIDHMKGIEALAKERVATIDTFALVGALSLLTRTLIEIGRDVERIAAASEKNAAATDYISDHLHLQGAR